MLYKKGVHSKNYQSPINRYSDFFIIVRNVLVDAGVLLTESFLGSSSFTDSKNEMFLEESISDGITPALPIWKADVNSVISNIKNVNFI